MMCQYSSSATPYTRKGHHLIFSKRLEIRDLPVSSPLGDTKTDTMTGMADENTFANGNPLAVYL